MDGWMDGWMDGARRQTNGDERRRQTGEAGTRSPLNDAGRGDGAHLGEGVRGGEVLELLDEREDVLAHLC